MTNYYEYLQSPIWHIRRISFFAAAGWKCQDCGAAHHLGRILNVHHLHYRTLGREQASDVRVLCRECHKQVHGRAGH